MKKMFGIVLMVLSLFVLAGCIKDNGGTKEEKKLVSIAVKVVPTKTSYLVGESLDLAGMQVDGIYNDGSSVIINAGTGENQYQVSGFSSAAAGLKTVTVTVGSLTASFSVVVADPEAPATLLAIQVVSLPNKTTYGLNGVLSLNGMVVKALYSDGTEETLTTSDYTVTGFDSLTAGLKTLTVTHEGKSATISVMISDKFVEDDPSKAVTVNFAYNYQGRGISFQETTPYKSLNGKTYNEGDLLPVWEALQSKLNIKFVDKKQSDNTDNQFKAYLASSFDGVDLINSTGANLTEYGINGNFVDISKYLNSMPNLNAFLTANPAVRASMTAADGGIYYTPYFDGFGEIEQMFLVRIDWVQDILDEVSPTFDAEAYAGTFTVETTTPESLDVNVTVANADGTTRVVKKAHTANILTTLEAIQNKTGASLAEAFRTYMQATYGNQGYAKLSDVFVGTDAAYDVDEMLALMHVVKANPKYLTREHATPKTAVEAMFPRTSENSRIRNLFRSLEMFGLRGMFSRYQWVYFDQDGSIKDARAEEATIDGVTQLSNMFKDGLINQNFDASTKTDHRQILLEGSYGFMTYDFNASSTPQGYINKAKELDPTFRFEAILPPVNNWLGDGQYFHFSEGVRSLKNEAWGIVKSVENDTAKLARILTLVDGMYDYSSNDSIGNVHLYGPAGYIDGQISYNGEMIPKISDAAMAEMTTLAKGNMINYLRNFVGATMAIGHIRGLGLEYQTLSDQGIAGIERINVAVNAGTFRLAGQYESTNPWYRLAPSLFALTKDQSQDMATLTYDDLWADAELKKLVRNAFSGEGLSVTKEVYFSTYVNKTVGDATVNTYKDIYQAALEEAYNRVNK
ncbi:putative aldouronate transport system substrate-binding protein [Acholeplasma morum]|uniref:bacterial Ig-like domain-containing protein n=1 Tax=Paracholeplasma morum TaxID=264637 RepID=UPI00195DBD2B|nr:bacterial Ig-like domain-containing protein [Paracholeplasma morum]MBM7453265.1 putative aldouronate transport system substrate-binding protein [Paracholeplasma morum]